jgi:hypothetical protein
MTLGHAGYASRPIGPDDPLVCVCGATIGTQRLLEPGNEVPLMAVRVEHAPRCTERLAHQQRHRGPADDCPECPRVLGQFFHTDDGSPCYDAMSNVTIDTGYSCRTTSGRWVSRRVLGTETSTATPTDGTVYP